MSRQPKNPWDQGIAAPGRRRLLAAAAGWLALALLPLRAVRAAATPESLQAAFHADSLEAALRDLFGDAPLTPDPAIVIEADDLAEDGAVVPVEVQLPAGLVASAVYLFGSENPLPLIGEFVFPLGVSGTLRTRVKLAGTSELVAVIASADGYRTARRRIEVAVGGCATMG